MQLTSLFHKHHVLIICNYASVFYSGFLAVKDLEKLILISNFSIQ